MTTILPCMDVTYWLESTISQLLTLTYKTYVFILTNCRHHEQLSVIGMSLGVPLTSICHGLTCSLTERVGVDL